MVTNFDELECATCLARQAGALALEHLARGISVEKKAEDEPVTAADREANDLIVDGLRRKFGDYGLVSEEAPDDGSRLQKERVWMVDPIDGTTDFIRGWDGFSCMIGLLVGDAPALGVVYQPRGDRLYFAAAGQGAWMQVADEAPERIAVSSVDKLEECRLVSSKSHRDAMTEKVRDELRVKDDLAVGSIGLKLGLIARGARDLYVNPTGYTKLWDVCGPQAILHEAGGRLTNVHGAPIHFRGEIANLGGLIASNRRLHDAAVARLETLFPAGS